MYLSLFIISALFLVTFYIAGAFVYNKNNTLEKYDIRNHFCFELWVRKGHQGVFIDVFILISAIIFFANYALFSIFSFSVLNVVNAFLALLIAFSVITICYLPLSKLKERCIFSIILITTSTVLNAMQIYESFTILRQYENDLIFIPIVVSSLIVIAGIIAMFYPRLFDFGMNKDQEGAIIRPKFFPLAFFEWLMIFITVLSPLYLVIVDIIK